VQQRGKSGTVWRLEATRCRHPLHSERPS